MENSTEEPDFRRAARPEDEPTVIRLARESFNGYLSHYRADPRLDPEKCDEIYAYWVSSACRSQAENQKVLVAEEDETVVGFGIAKVDSEGMGEAVLAGVSSQFRQSRTFCLSGIARGGNALCPRQGSHPSHYLHSDTQRSHSADLDRSRMGPGIFSLYLPQVDG